MKCGRSKRKKMRETRGARILLSDSSLRESIELPDDRFGEDNASVALDVSFGENNDAVAVDPSEGISYINDDVQQRERERGDGDEFLQWLRNDWNSKAEETVDKRLEEHEILSKKSRNESEKSRNQVRPRLSLRDLIREREIKKRETDKREIQEGQMETDLNPLVRCVLAALFKRRQIEQQRQAAHESAMELLLLSFGLLSQLERLSVFLELEGVQQGLLLAAQSNNEAGKEPSNREKKPMFWEGEILPLFAGERNDLQVLRTRLKKLYEEIEANASTRIESAQAVFKRFDKGVRLQTKKSTTMPTEQQLVNEVAQGNLQLKEVRKYMHPPFDSNAPEFEFPPIPSINSNTPEDLFLLESRLVSDVRYLTKAWREQEIYKESNKDRYVVKTESIVVKYMSPTNRRAPQIEFETEKKHIHSQNSLDAFRRFLHAIRVDKAETITAGVFKGLWLFGALRNAVKAMNEECSLHHAGNRSRWFTVNPLSDLRASKSVLMQLMDERLPSNLKFAEKEMRNSHAALAV
jgi:hypothetical protein